jgi:colanic acid biosynthesis glycosyl transferase WcaI
VGKQEVEQVIREHKPRNIVSLPYQPLSEIKYSLSAADVHVVTVGETVVGVVHPCKVYGAMTLERPVLLVGPDPCHVSDILAANAMGWHVKHGDVDATVRILREVADAPRPVLAERGKRAARVAHERFSKPVLCGVVCDKLERNLINV